MSLKIKGIIVALLTPFDQQGDIDAVALKKLVNYLIDCGVAGLFPGGTTGEGPLLTLAERRLLAELVIEAVAGRIPVVMHTGAITTAATLVLTQHAQAAGAQAAAIVPPYFYHHSDDALFRHFATIAEQTPDFPLYLYNNPAVCNNTISPALAHRLVEQCPNIVGMKDSSGSLEMLTDLAAAYGDNFNTASGPDGQILMAAAAGLDACVSGNANVAPEIIVALHRAASAGELAQARELQHQVDQVRRWLEDGRDLSLFKAAMARRGLPVGAGRPPLQPADPSDVERRWRALSNLGLGAIPA